MPASRNTYVKKQWENEITELNADNLNHIEEGIEVNNLLAKENANYIDEIYAAFIEQLNLSYDMNNRELTLSFGSTTGNNPTTRFNTSFTVSLPLGIVMNDQDIDDCWDEEEDEEEPVL